MIVKLIAAIIVADCIALMLYFYDVIRLDFYYILAGAIIATIAFTAGYHEGKNIKRMKPKCEYLKDSYGSK